MRNKLSNVLWGLFFVIIGVGIAGNVMDLWNFHLFFDGWWTLLIIIPCFIGMIQSGFGTGSTIGFIVGVLLLLGYQVNLRFSVWELVVPAILVFIGIRIIFQGAFRRKPNFDQSYTTGTSQGQEYTYSGAPRSEYSAIFSSNRIHITDQFYSTSVSAIFGGLVLDLREAIITGDCEINAQAIFGGIDIYLPQGVKVKISNVPIFGGISNKHPQPADTAAPTVYLNSTCMFGGIDIK